MQFPNIIKRFAKYTIFSSGAFWFDLLLIFLLVEFIHLQYLVAATGGFVIAHSLNFALNRKWNFHETKEGVGKSYTSFIIFGFLCLAFIIVSLGFVVEVFHVNYLIARILIACFVGFVNFSFNYFVSFRMGSHLKKDLNITK
ncbi:MAG: GtrA family protein [Nanoarchaeota archaeon]|nr:GtrA family protein [Nanoarchaeota archaeon]MBU1051362.1 GtrA family protein [Nanoarchaeota archaeon]MBU1988377.1 GtrA family protein [Nanoarchaeota archaeon]